MGRARAGENEGAWKGKRNERKKKGRDCERGNQEKVKKGTVHTVEKIKMATHCLAT